MTKAEVAEVIRQELQRQSDDDNAELWFSGTNKVDGYIDLDALAETIIRHLS